MSGRRGDGIVRAGLRVAEAVAVLAPLLGRLVFALVDFKPAVTLYAVVVGLALLLRHGLDRVQLSFEIRDTVRRYCDGFHAR